MSLEGMILTLKSWTKNRNEVFKEPSQPLYTSPPQRQPLPIEPKNETNDGGWSVSAGGYCNIFFCEDDADDWIIEKGGSPSDPTTYTKRELTEKRQWVGLTDEDMAESRTHNFDFIDGARWAEAKLREKNG